MEPLEWVEHLATRLRNRNNEIERYDDYYSGRHPLLFTTSDFREAFGRMLDGYADNWCRIIIDAAIERLTPTGFRFPGLVEDEEAETADKDAWAIWRANKLDSRAQVGFVESLVSGISYLMVWYPDGTVVDDGQVSMPEGSAPRITVEHASEVIVEHDPGDRDKRLAGLKMWGQHGYRRATLYLPDGIYKFQEGELRDAFGNPVLDNNRNIQFEWQPSEMEPAGPNPLGVVPIVPLVNRPRLLYPDGESELQEIIPNQDAINKLAKDMLVASEYGAFPQRWATGVEVPKDPVTNEPIDDWVPDISRFLTTANPNARVGSLQAADLSNFVVALDNRVNSMASQSRTPPHYLNASADRLSGESMKAAEAGLVARVREKMIHLGDGILEAMSLAFAILGDDRANVQDAVLLWSDPETRTEAAHADAVVKKFESRIIPWQITVEDLGYSPPEIDRMRKMRQREALEFGFGADLDEDLAEPA